jgi:hypothetical protein
MTINLITVFSFQLCLPHLEASAASLVVAGVGEDAMKKKNSEEGKGEN